MMVIINAQVKKKVHPRFPGTWNKALDFYRFTKSANIALQVIYVISHSSFGKYLGLRSGSNSIIISNVGSLKDNQGQSFLKREMELVLPSVTSLSYLPTRLFLEVIWTIGNTQQCKDIVNSKLYDKLPISVFLITKEV